MSRQTVFISYGHEVSDDVVRRLVDDLNKENLYDVFLDSDYLYKGDWENKIDNAIQRCEHFVFIVSKKSISLQGYCLNELTRAVECKKDIIPIMIDDSYVPLSIVRLQRLMLKSALAPDGGLIESVYATIYQRLLRILNNDEEIGLFDDGIDLNTKVQVFDPFEIVHHTKSFVGRDSFFKDFENWVKNENSLPIYLLKAAPGIGKTAICSNLTIKFPDNVAGIHFCTFNNKIKTDAKNIIKNLVGQIAGRNEEYAQEVRNIVAREDMSQIDTKRLFEELIIEAGNKVSFKQPQVIIIDALDEAVINNKNEIAETVVSYQNMLPPWLKIMCSTRPQQNVVSYFSSCHTYAIDEQNDENISDIKLYYDTALKKYPFDADKLRILLKKTHGSFLYAKEIVKNISSGDLKIENVKDFPDGIYSYYKVWFDRIFLHGGVDYAPIKKILSLLLVGSVAPTIDFLSEATGEDESEINRHLSKVTSFFVIVDESLKYRHKSILDWLNNRDECPAEYYISRPEGYKLLLNYILEKKNNSRRWSRDPYVVLDYANCLIGLKKYDDLIDLCMDEEYVETCFNSKFYTLYEGLTVYINGINFLYNNVDKEAAFEIYESECFTNIFIKYRKHMYNSGLFIKLKEAGFGKFLKDNDVSDNVDYDLGVIQFLYISLSFKESYDAILEFKKEHDLDSLDLDDRSEYERMAMLIYRKLVLFDELIDIGPETIEDARRANNKYEESLANLTLSKVHCRMLDKAKCYAAADNAVRLLEERVREEEEEGTQMGDHLFLAEDYRVYADACIWHMDLPKAKDCLTKAGAIYARYNQHDRYYTRFLYTSLFYEIVSKGEVTRIEELIRECNLALQETKDKYDTAQTNFLTSLYYLTYSKGDASLLAKAEVPCSEAIELDKKLFVNLELLEAETLYNLICETQGISRKYDERFNEFTDKWIEHVEQFIRNLI